MEAERREREKNGPAPLTQIPGSVPEDCFKNVILLYFIALYFFGK